jgi:hypothetical protein
VKKTDEITVAELFAGCDKELPSGRRLKNLAERLAPKIKIELSKRWPEIDWDFLKDSIEDNAVAMLDIPLVEKILLPAWRQYRDLESKILADRKEQVVWLAQHTLSSVHNPYLDVLCHGVRTAKAIRLDVSADFTISEFGLVVQSRRIRRIKTGNIEGKGTVAFKDLKLEKSFGKIELLDEIGLGEGIPLA